MSTLPSMYRELRSMNELIEEYDLYEEIEQLIEDALYHDIERIIESLLDDVCTESSYMVDDLVLVSPSSRPKLLADLVGSHERYGQFAQLVNGHLTQGNNGLYVVPNELVRRFKHLDYDELVSVIDWWLRDNPVKFTWSEK